ncbi:hypothetical protein NDU88_000616 [Pleurodeles waltl]|uniref:Uncharacterized protein n=1 Tax=Pleurodeles waltl TaxID=8319 RepID=A0AAV7UQH7_PLEWA|nr:hypothetical protein NDU88_000616 [Pleurodeles waltl]
MDKSRRELETPATLHVNAGTECHPPETCERDYGHIGNPEERIPDPLPAIQGEEGEKDASAITGNPDIRVPEGLERDNGLNVRRALLIESAEGKDAEEGDAEKKEGRQTHRDKRRRKRREAPAQETPQRGKKVRRTQTPPRPRRDVAQTGTECRPPETCERDYGHIRNPEERIPDPLPAIQGEEGEEDASAITGNPDIRVPEGLERDNGLNARRAFRELETPATLHVNAGTECRPPETCERDYGHIRNPEERIPDPLPAIQGEEGEEDASAITGNPDIRVPEGLERDNGLNARRALLIESAEGEDAEEGDAKKKEGRQTH